jgi:hypothetical protein
VKQKYILMILFILSISLAHAADLSGKLSGIPGAEVIVVCTGFNGSTTISNNGTFLISGLPANKSCSFTIENGNSRSVTMPFSTKQSRSYFNGSLRAAGNRIFVILE